MFTPAAKHLVLALRIALCLLADVTCTPACCLASASRPSAPQPCSFAMQRSAVRRALHLLDRPHRPEADTLTRSRRRSDLAGFGQQLGAVLPADISLSPPHPPPPSRPPSPLYVHMSLTVSSTPRPRDLSGEGRPCLPSSRLSNVVNPRQRTSPTQKAFAPPSVLDANRSHIFLRRMHYSLT
jgi:hypothetical protein